jgi:DNA-binding MarR family transcriptional regulator
MDLERFRVPIASIPNSVGRTAPSPAKTFGLPRHAPGEWFLQGPIPWSWLTAAMTLKGKALHVGIVLWQRAQMTKTDVVVLPTKVMSDAGVSRSSMQRGLSALEEAGLVSAVRGPGKRPRIRLLPASQAKPCVADVPNDPMEESQDENE